MEHHAAAHVAGQPEEQHDDPHETEQSGTTFKRIRMPPVPSSQSRHTTLTSRPRRGLKIVAPKVVSDLNRRTVKPLTLPHRQTWRWVVLRDAAQLTLTRRWSHAVRLASSTAPTKLETLLPHLFAPGFSHPFINSFLRLGLPMTFPRGIDRSPTAAGDRGCCRHDRCLSL
jgi:hypothetical protein